MCSLFDNLDTSNDAFLCGNLLHLENVGSRSGWRSFVQQCSEIKVLQQTARLNVLPGRFCLAAQQCELMKRNDRP